MGPCLFGKLPAHGDFISRGLSTATRKSLDQWVTRHIGQRTLPVDGVRGRVTLAKQTILIVIQQSRDKHGRVFPIVALTRDGGQSLDTVMHWCDLAADELYAAITGKLQADTLLPRLPNLASEPGDRHDKGDIIWQKDKAPDPVAIGLAALNSD